ncbi:DNA translocase FtsK [Priestia megaterium]|nr:DNA translocase FtsK [Priestia megaterium]
MGFIRRVMDYLLGYEIKEIVVDENGRTEEVPLTKSKKQEKYDKALQETVNEKITTQTQPQTSPVTQPMRSQKEISDEKQDIHAKVVYHYPKGKFRFPLIGDEEMSFERPNRRSENRRKASADHPDPVSSFYSESTVAEPLNPNKQTAADSGTKKKETIMNQRKKPFRPTEIPSPVYGFNKRPVNHSLSNEEDIVEYELSQSAISKFPPSYEAQKQDTKKDVYVEPLIRPEFSDVSSENRELSEQNEMKHVHSPDFAKQQLNEVMEDNKEDKFIQEDERIEHSTASLSAAIDLKDSDSLPNGFSTEQADRHSHSMAEDEVQEEVVIATEEQGHAHSDENIDFQKEQMRVPTEGVVQSNPEPVYAEKQPNPEKKEEAAKGKRLVPFNVMMLKKDREKVAKKTDVAVEKLSPVQNQEEHKLIETKAEPAYLFPPMSLLNVPPAKIEEDNQWVEEQRDLLDMTLTNFNVRARVVNVTQGPTVTRFEVQPEPGVKVNKITNLTDDIKLSLAARDIRIEAPIPGKNTIGIEVPNRQSKPVLLREILRHPSFQKDQSPLTVALGLDISGSPVVTDLNKMPHGLIAGATGSGKSVCINTIIVSLLYKAAPHEVKLMLIDPKMVELAPYNGIPHLVSPVITDAKAATAALKWAVEEMERRYELFAHSGVRDITRYNERVRAHNEKSGELPYLVIIIDELADLMMVSPGEVEEAICRIAQKARACGIHLLLATQRPSVDVITGLIKANVPTRVAFSVSSQVDSRTIIDTGGAEKLLGKGDMLLLENGSSKSVRIQGNFVSDEEIDRVVAHVKKQMKPTYLFDQQDLLKKQQTFSPQEEDELFYEACEFVLSQDGASTSSLQRRFRIGYNRAARLIDMMEQQGIISEARGSKPRDVLITEEELQEIESQTASHNL